MKMIREKFRAAMLMGAAVSVLVFAAGATAQNQNDANWRENPPAHDNPWPYNNPQRSPVLAVVGDISCQPGEEASGEASKETCTDPKAPYTSTSLYQSQEATANQIEAMKPDAVALVGDLQYQVGRYSDFENSYDLTYGAFKMISRPAPGNHEFYDEHGETGVAGYGYFSYFNGFLIDTTADANQGKPQMTTIPDPCPSNPACGPGKTPSDELSPQPIPRADGQAGHFELGANAGQNGTGVGDGWYSYNLGSWHLISLNIECSTAAGRLFDRWRLVCRRTCMAAKGSRREPRRVYPRVLASAHVQRHERDQPRRHCRQGLLATALRTPSRLGAERTRPPLRPLPPS